MNTELIEELAKYIADYIFEELSRGIPAEEITKWMVVDAINAYLGGAR